MYSMEAAEKVNSEHLTLKSSGSIPDERKHIFFDGESRIVFFIILIWQFFLPNYIYLIACLLIIFVIVYYLQQPLKPGIFTFIACNHFLQIIGGVWLANYVGKDLNFREPNLSNATLASLAGLIALFAPIFYYQNKLPFLTLDSLKKHAARLSVNKVFNCYLVAFFITSSLSAVAFLIPGITQVIFSLINIKWLFFLLFGFLSMIKKEKRNIFYLFIFIEFASGFYSYFSDFKTVIYFLIVLFATLVRTINIRQLIIGLITAGLLALLALVWTGIKTEYRLFINKGTRQQVTSVSKEEALDKLYALSNGVNEQTLNSSMYQVLDRLQYTYYFAKAISRVPSVLHFTGGRNWLDNVEFATTPRILNPNKPNFDATEKAKKYTGLRLAGRKSGSSFSLGYFAESYIDFGFFGMMLPLFLIGLMYGITYWYFMRNSSSNFLFNFSVVTAFFMEFNGYEMDGTYLLGRFLATLVTFFVLIKVFAPLIIKYISAPKLKDV